jgi:hypothetical protein
MFGDTNVQNQEQAKVLEQGVIQICAIKKYVIIIHGNH